MLALNVKPSDRPLIDHSTVSHFRPGTAAPALPHGRKASHPADLGWREPMIRESAYLRSLSHPGCPGKELEDWLAAEREIDDLITCGAAPYC